MGSYAKVCGPSSIAPYLPGEDPEERHSRRAQEAYLRRDWLSKFCGLHGLTLIGRGGWKVWHIRGPVNARWRPRTGEMIISGEESSPIKCYDVLQVSREVSSRLPSPVE